MANAVKVLGADRIRVGAVVAGVHVHQVTDGLLGPGVEIGMSAPKVFLQEAPGGIVFHVAPVVGPLAEPVAVVEHAVGAGFFAVFRIGVACGIHPFFIGRKRRSLFGRQSRDGAALVEGGQGGAVERRGLDGFGETGRGFGSSRMDVKPELVGAGNPAFEFVATVQEVVMEPILQFPALGVGIFRQRRADPNGQTAAVDAQVLGVVLPEIADDETDPGIAAGQLQCPAGALSVDEEAVVALDAEKCIACELCVPACFYTAIDVNFA